MKSGKLTVVKAAGRPSADIEPIVCPGCGERASYALEIVVAPVKRKGAFKWLRKSTKKVLVCSLCFRKGTITEIAD